MDTKDGCNLGSGERRRVDQENDYYFVPVKRSGTGLGEAGITLYTFVWFTDGEFVYNKVTYESHLVC